MDSLTVKLRHLLILVVLITSAFTSANADPIIVTYNDADGLDPLGGYHMTQFAEPAIPLEGCGNYYDGVYSTASPISGEVRFMEQGGTTPLCMSVQDPDWWEWDHGNVFTTDVPWVELLMPTDTRAFSLWVGSNMTGRGWIEGEDGDGNTTRTYFGGNTGIDLGWGASPGFGVYTPDSCGVITKIIIEPFEWGTGNFAINQDPCVQVAEPGTLGLLGIGLLAMTFVTRRRRFAQANL